MSENNCRSEKIIALFRFVSIAYSKKMFQIRVFFYGFERENEIANLGLKNPEFEPCTFRVVDFFEVSVERELIQNMIDCSVIAKNIVVL